MREALCWLSATGLAFLVTAGAFLMLANLSSDRQEQRLPTPRSSESGPVLKMDLREERLEELAHAPDQNLEIEVSNAGTKPVSGVNATVRVASEDTSLPEVRFYRADVGKLGAGDAKTVSFEVDLSPFGSTAPGGTAPLEPPRFIVEVRATTPGGASAVRTAILPP